MLAIREARNYYLERVNDVSHSILCLMRCVMVQAVQQIVISM